MNRNQESIKKRKEFIMEALTDSKKAAAVLNKHARKLAAAKTTTERVRLLSEVLFISETTIYREFSES